MEKQIARGIYQPRSPRTPEDPLVQMRQLYGQPEMQWKSAEQKRALTTMVIWREQLVAVLATGAGKSMLGMLLCTLPDAAATVLVVPLVSLRGDLLRCVVDLRMDHFEWTPGERREAALVLVSVEAASSPDLISYA